MSKGFNMFDLIKNKKAILEQAKGQTVSYSDFVEQSNNSIYKLSMRRVLADIKLAKEDFEKKKEIITFTISGSKDFQFGKKVSREDSYVIEDSNKINNSIHEYFTEDAEIKTKNKDSKEKFLSKLDEEIIDIKTKKNVDFVFETAKISIKIEPVSQYFEISGPLGAKIDLSK